MRHVARVCCVVLLFAVVAEAQRPQRGTGRTFPDPFRSALDVDSDGEISAAEIAKASARLKELDADGDGNITTGEYFDAIRQAMRNGGGRPGQPSSRGGSFRAGANALEGAGLRIGEALPDVKAFDDQGQEFKLTDMKGEYSVVVFGCLT